MGSSTMIRSRPVGFRYRRSLTTNGVCRPLSSLLKNLIRNGFSASFCDFPSARGHFRRQLQLLEGSRLPDPRCSGPTHHPTACTWRFLSRQRLYAAPVKVNSHPTFSSPRNFTFFSIPMTFIHPNDCSTRFRFCWLSS